MADPLYEAMSHLGAALSQSIPSDDHIIMEHVREAHALIQSEWRRRESAAQNSTPPGMRCECDYDGDSTGYRKTSRNVCPVHDPCESCDELGASRTPHGWYCPTCELIDHNARVLAVESFGSPTFQGLDSLDARTQHELWERATTYGSQRL